jgi:RNA polymerase sigma-70 factor (ECF subfamily)
MSTNLTDLTDSTSSSLLRRVGAQNAAAWGRLAHVYTPFVYGWCRRFGLQQADLEDVAQEVFRSVARGLGGYLLAPRGRFRGWLWGITRKKLADHFRRAAREVRPAGGETVRALLQEIAEPPSSWEFELDRDEGDVFVVQRTLQLLRDDFEEHTWQAFWRTTVGGERAADIAVELGMTKKAVRQAKYRILKRLREELEFQLGEPEQQS